MSGSSDQRRSAPVSAPGAAGAGREVGDPRRSIYGHDYWLRRCDGFRVETATRPVGRAAGIRFGQRTNEPQLLEVRAGRFGRKLLLVSVAEITEILPSERRIVLNDPPRLFPG